MTNRESNKEAEVLTHFDTLDSCLETFWCITEPSSDNRLLAEGAQHAAKEIRALFTSPQQETEGREITEGWQPIETLQHDGTQEDQEKCGKWHGSVLVYVPDKFGGVVMVAQLDSDMWLYGPDEDRSFSSMGSEPTHWMPLPAQPEPRVAPNPQSIQERT